MEDFSVGGAFIASHEAMVVGSRLESAFFVARGRDSSSGHLSECERESWYEREVCFDGRKRIRFDSKDYQETSAGITSREKRYHWAL